VHVRLAPVLFDKIVKTRANICREGGGGGLSV